MNYGCIGKTLTALSISLLIVLSPLSASASLWEAGIYGPAKDYRFSTNLDIDSLMCMGCHSEETENNQFEVNTTGQLMNNRGTHGHPVGVRYEDVNGRGTSLRSVYEISSVVQLPEGRVSCVSCHKSHDPVQDDLPHGELVMSNRGSKLCFECHNL